MGEKQLPVVPRPTLTQAKPSGTIAVKMDHKQPLLSAQGKTLLI